MRFSITKRLTSIAMIPATLFGLVMVAAPAQAAVVDTQDLQGDIVYLTNKQRALHGCEALHTDVRLTEASVGHSAYMAQTGAFGHIGADNSDFIDRVKAAHYPRPLAENIAFGYRTGVDVVVAWMNSPPHRANLLNCDATTVGVGAVYASDGTSYITQDFGD